MIKGMENKRVLKSSRNAHGGSLIECGHSTWEGGCMPNPEKSEPNEQDISPSNPTS